MKGKFLALYESGEVEQVGSIEKEELECYEDGTNFLFKTNEDGDFMFWGGGGGEWVEVLGRFRPHWVEAEEAE